MSRSGGKLAEQTACDYLKKQGLKLIQANYRSRYGEIDLVMSDQQTLVFIEVRLRNRDDRVSAIESVDYHKQQRLIKTAEIYLTQQGSCYYQTSRFDVIAMQDYCGTMQIQWLKNAFSLS